MTAIAPRHGCAVAGAGMALPLLSALLAEPARAAELELPVPRVTLYPGDVIGDEQLVERAFIAHTVARARVVDGARGADRQGGAPHAAAGQPIPVKAVRDPYVVTQGKTAVVVFEDGGLTITTRPWRCRTAASATSSVCGTLDSGNVIKGTVAPDGTVRLAGP